MKPIVKKVLLGVVGVLALATAGAGGFVWTQTSAYDDSMNQVYDIPVPSVTLTTDAATLARGEHLARSIGGCTVSDCHGSDLGGGKTVEVGPLGTFTAPNITKAGMGAAYTDGEILRLLTHGLKRDGRSVRFMPVHEVNWMPESDLVAIISYVRSVPDVSKANGPLSVGMLGKIMDRKDAIVLDVARRIDHGNIEKAPPPTPTAEYGKFIGKMCLGCHGDTYSGGPIPGAPPDLPVPTNITPHETGIAAYTYADFDKLLNEGIRPNGSKLDPFMPVEALGKMDEVERKALWEFLRSLPPKAFGNR